MKKYALFLPARNRWMIVACLGLLLSEQTTVLGQVIESAPHEAFSNPALDRGSKYALGILDSSLELLGRWGWGACRGVAGMGDYLLTGRGPTLLWLDATDRRKPVIVWEKMTNGPLTNFVIRDSIGYALVGSSSLLVIDLRNPATPIIRSEFPIVSRLLSLAVEGTIAFVKRYLGYVYCIDVSNPSSPFLRATIRGTSAQWGKLTISDHNLYIGDQSGFTEHIDVSNLDSALVTILENVAFTATAVHAKDTLLFLGNGSDRLYIYSTSVPNSPTRLSNFSIGFSGIVSIAVDGQRAFVGTGDGRIVAIRISDLRNPVVLGVYSPSITRPGISATHVVSRDTFIFCAYGYCLTGISTANPGSMNVLSNFETGYGNPKVKVRDGLAYVTSGYSGVWVVDVSQPEQPRRLSNLHTEGFANDIVLDSANAYISLNDPQYPYSQDANNGILAVDITRTESLSVIGSLTMDSPFAISKSGSLLFVAQQTMLDLHLIHR